MIQHTQKYTKKAQAITEMAVFGVVLIFIIGAIVRQGLSASMAQNQNLKAMRIALRMSLASSQAGQAKRNSARVLFIEDRLSPEFGKFGALSRTPSYAQAGGSMTNLLFMPVDEGEENNIPVMDVIINGKHFEFTNARFVEHELLEDRIITRIPNNIDPDGVCNPVSLGGSCIKVRTDAEYPNIRNEWRNGVRLFYTYVPNTNRRSFCVTGPSCGVLNIRETFDLNRNGVFEDDDPETTEERSAMAWQWDAILGLPSNVKIDRKEGVYPAWDVDGDGHDEVLYRIVSTDPVSGGIKRIVVLDYNEGDVDGGWNEYSHDPRPGIMQDTNIYTFNDDGTYLEIKEGNLYIPGTNQYVRSARKKDQVDVITRLFQLSNNTGRFCTREGNVPVLPVEACDDCTSRFNISKICYDTSVNVMFIRSRLLDRSGSKWITDVTNELGE